MNYTLNPEERMKQIVKLTGLDSEIKKCIGLHMRKSKKLNEKEMAKLKQDMQMQYGITLERLRKLKESYENVLNSFVQENIKDTEIARGITAGDAVKYLNELIQRVEGYKKEDLGDAGATNGGSQGV